MCITSCKLACRDHDRVHARKNYFINLTLKRPLPYEVSNHRHPSRGHPESRLSERYSFTASLHTAATLVADELARCVSDSEIRVLLGSSPTWINQGRSKLSFGSTAYLDLIENLCFFKPSDRMSDVSQLIHRSSVHASCYSDKRFQSSYVVPCFEVHVDMEINIFCFCVATFNPVSILAR
jgi:hypothetical protein